MKTVLILVTLMTTLSTNAQSVVNQSAEGTPISLETRDIGIRCESKDKSVLVVGFVPKDTNEGLLTVKVDGKEFRLLQNNNIGSSGVSIHGVEDVLNGVLTVSVKSREHSNNKYDLKLSSIPKTMSGTFRNGFYDVKFSANLSFLKDDNSSCDDGCIVMPIEVTQSNTIFKHWEVDCISRY